MKALYLAVFIMLPATLCAQSETQKKSNQPVKAGYGVAVTQIQPEFPGGDESLNSYLVENIQYPREAKIKGIEGRVYIGFLVDKTGKIKNERVLGPVSDELDAETMRVVRAMPDWKPGTIGGENADVQYILAIDFILPPKHSEE